MTVSNIDKAVAYIRKLAKAEGRGCRVFNDATTFGRSIKVWGWGDDHYVNAVVQLQIAGIKASLVTTPARKNCYYYASSGRNTRIHLYDK